MCVFVCVNVCVYAIQAHAASVYSRRMAFKHETTFFRWNIHRILDSIACRRRLSAFSVQYRRKRSARYM